MEELDQSFLDLILSVLSRMSDRITIPDPNPFLLNKKLSNDDFLPRVEENIKRFLLDDTSSSFFASINK